MSKKTLLLCSVLLVGCASFFAPSAAHATSITYVASGTGGDGALSASAQFTTSAGQLQIILTNTLSLSQLNASGQALSDITFTVSNAPGTLGSTSASGQQGNVSTTGVVTYTSGSPTRWLGAGGLGTFSISGDTITMDAIGGGQPTEMIAPSVANGGSYPTNTGFSNFDAYTIGPATFTLDLAGITAATSITGATFSFGTGPDTFLGGRGMMTPEPSALLLLGTGIVSVAGFLRRRQRPV